MFSLDDDETILWTLLIHTEDYIMTIILMETMDGLNLQKVKVVLPHCKGANRCFTQ